MDTIIVPVKDLAQRVKELSEDKMEFVQISLIEPDDDSDVGFMSFSAWKKSEYMGVDYDTIDAVSDEDAS